MPSAEYRNATLSNLSQFYCPGTVLLPSMAVTVIQTTPLPSSCVLPSPTLAGTEGIQSAFKPGKYSADGDINLFLLSESI